MDIRIVNTKFDSVWLVEPDCFQDHRGFFFESYSKRRFADHGLNLTFVQDNHSRSVKNVVRGLHYQDMTAPQFRLVRCTVGEVWDVVVDLRVQSPTFGQWLAVPLNAEKKTQVLIGPTFAHGFAALSEFAELQYKCTEYHTPSAEHILAWDDPDLAIPWPVKDPILSTRDKHSGLSLRQYLKTPSFNSHIQPSTEKGSC
jgi:dTDP-4-dehydrorhamnose 3,5-epimerase